MMKHFALIFLGALTLEVTAQTTFNADMTCAPEGFENVFVTGPWCGWCANDTYNTMTDPDGDGVYTVEVADLTGVVEYKYAIDGFAYQENLVNDMVDGATCAPVTDYSGYANRQIDAGSVANDYYGTCDGTCNDTPPPSGGTVLFRVDMSEYAGTYGTVNLNGSFNGWCGACATMTDDDGDMVFELAVDLQGGTVEYKFTLDGWTAQEEFMDGDPCTSTIDGYINRTLEITGDLELPVVCWNLCTGCEGEAVPGCTDPIAINYNATATEDDGSCLYNEDETLLFMETFSNGFAGDNGIGSWTVEDTGGNQIWVEVGPDGYGAYSDGAPTNAVHPAGEYSTEIGPLESVTAANGWVIFDNDFYNTPISDGYQDTEGTLTSPSLDFGNLGSVLVNWESYYRYCCYPYAPVYLEVGVTEGGVTSWTTFDAHGDFIEAANTASANPLPVRVDISCAAAYQSDVKLRFAYRQPPETGAGYSHYYWGIDDVVVTSNDVVNDIAITQVTNGDVYNVWEYRNTPIEQAISTTDGGLVAGVMYRNMGIANQSNVNVLVEILNNQGTVVHQVSETLDEVLTFANALSCPANEQDTLFIATGWQPNQVGTYTLRISMFGDQNDEIPADNILSKEFKYSMETYAHDNESALDGELRPRESNDIVDYFDPTGYGSFYHFPNEGSVAYGVAVRFGPNCGLDINGSIRDLEFETRLYSMDGSTAITDSPFDAAYWIYNPEWSNPEGTSGVEIYLPFDDPIVLGTWPTDGQYYFASVISEYESIAELTVLAELDSDTDTSTGQFSQSGSGDFVWFTSQTATPSIRLITAPMGCQDPEACNYQSGASMGGASCDYISCLGCTDDMACNYDGEAAVEDGSCDYSCFGCTDSTAVNWNPNASIDDGSCEYFATTCSFLGHEGWDELAAGLYADSAMWHYVGSEASGEWVLSLPTTIQEPTSGSTFAVSMWSGLSMTNLPSGLEVADFPESLEGGEQACLSYSGMPTTAGQYPIMVSGSMTVLLFGSPYEVGTFSVVASMDIFPNPNPILGCTYSNAANFVLFANQDDGSCEFAGCTEPTADNYQPLATVDDGSCEFDNCVSTCPGDLNGDGTVGTPDLLSLLSSFGNDCN